MNWVQLVSGEWLTHDRLRVYPRIFLALYIVFIVAWVVMANGLIDSQGRPIGTDFASYYAAARLALEGQAPLAYDFAAHLGAEKAAFGPELLTYYRFSYPPTFMLVVMPLGFFPYLVALLVWQGGTLAFFVAMARKLAGRGDITALTLAFPACIVVLGHGQNAFLTAGLLAGGLYFLDRRTILAGIMFGLLSFKPHLGVLIPLVLILSRQWTVFFSAAITTVIFVALSWLIIGTEIWTAFLSSTILATEILHGKDALFFKMQSLFATLRGQGTGLHLAYTLHIGMALGAGGVVMWVWKQRVDKRLKYSSLGIGSLMLPPYLLDYDLTILAIPIICLGSYGLQYGYRAGLVNLLCLAWLAPILVRPLNMLIAVPWAQIILIFLLYQTVRLCRDQINLGRNDDIS